MATKEQLIEFYSYFESCWDYAHLCFDRGLLLHEYIMRYRRSFSYLFQLPKPKYFSEIPKELHEGYKLYLLQFYAERKGIDLLDIDDPSTIFNDDIAAEESQECLVKI